MTDSEQNNDVAPEVDGMKSSSGARGFLGVIYKLAVLALLVVFVWEADQIRQELQSGSIDANVGSVHVSGGSIDANVDFPSTQTVYVRGGDIEVSGTVDANVDFPSAGVQDVRLVGVDQRRVNHRGEITAGWTLPVFIQDADPVPVRLEKVSPFVTLDVNVKNTYQFPR